MIRGVKKIIVPVDDETRALEFWLRIGFQVVLDAPYEGGRWLEVTPPDRGVILVLNRRPKNEPRREAPDSMPHSDVFFDCEDIQRTHAEMTSLGVRFSVHPVRMSFGWWSLFEDADGTRYALCQWT